MSDVRERQRLESQLLQAQKSEPVGRLAGGIAHDFNNVLAGIVGSAEMLREELPAGAPQREQVEAIVEAAQRGAALTRQLLAFARRQVVQPAAVKTAEAITRLVPMLQRVLGEDVRLETRAAANPGTTRIDPGQLETVLLTLAAGAREAMPRGGTLTIATADVGESHLAEAEAAPGPRVEISVVAGGAGSAVAGRECREPVLSAAEFGVGGEAGLAMCRDIVRQAGGEIVVSRDPGGATTFRIHLPRAEPEAVRVEAALRGTETVLLVEDDPIIRRLGGRMLRSLGYRVLEAEDGAAALEVMNAHPGPIDVLATDVIMPRMGGEELAERLTHERPQTPVLFVSGHPSETIARWGIAKPGAHFLAKPFTKAEIAAKLREALAGRPRRGGVAPNGHA